MTRAARAIRTWDTKECADVLRAMGEGTRLRILQSLLCREQCVNEIAQELDLPQPHVSHHLQILRSVGLVEGQRDGQRICYRLLPCHRIERNRPRASGH